MQKNLFLLGGGRCIQSKNETKCVEFVTTLLKLHFHVVVDSRMLAFAIALKPRLHGHVRL